MLTGIDSLPPVKSGDSTIQFTPAGRILRTNMEAARQDPELGYEGVAPHADGKRASLSASYRAERISFWNSYVRKPASAGYYRRLAEIYRVHR